MTNLPPPFSSVLNAEVVWLAEQSQFCHGSFKLTDSIKEELSHTAGSSVLNVWHEDGGPLLTKYGKYSTLHILNILLYNTQ